MATLKISTPIGSIFSFTSFFFAKKTATCFNAISHKITAFHTKSHLLCFLFFCFITFSIFSRRHSICLFKNTREMRQGRMAYDVAKLSNGHIEINQYIYCVLIVLLFANSFRLIRYIFFK